MSQSLEHCADSSGPPIALRLAPGDPSRNGRNWSEWTATRMVGMDSHAVHRRQVISTARGIRRRPCSLDGLSTQIHRRPGRPRILPLHQPLRVTRRAVREGPAHGAELRSRSELDRAEYDRAHLAERFAIGLYAWTVMSVSFVAAAALCGCPRQLPAAALCGCPRQLRTSTPPSVVFSWLVERADGLAMIDAPDSFARRFEGNNRSSEAPKRAVQAFAARQNNGLS